MTACLEQIKTCYEQEKMTPDEISQELGMDIVAVKAALAQSSVMFRKAARKEGEDQTELNYSEDQAQRMLDKVYQLGMTSEDEHLQFKAAVFVINEFKGRNNTVKNLAGNTFNVLQINQALQGAREGTSKLIRDVEEVK